MWALIPMPCLLGAVLVLTPRQAEHNSWWRLGMAVVLAEIATHPTASGAEGALDYYRQALELAGQLGMRPLTAHCHLGLTKLYRQTGDQEKAEEHLAVARAMCREMGVSGWVA